MSDIIVVGSVAYDTVETKQARRERILGGSATFFSIASSYMTTPAVVAVIGEDFRESDLETLRTKGVDVGGIERVPGKTFFWEGVYGQDFNDRTTITTELNVFADFSPSIPDGWRGAPYLMLANIHPALQLRVLEQMEAPALVGVDTMNLWIDTELDTLKKVLAKADVLFINDEESRMLAGTNHLGKAAERILAMGPKALVIKKGEHGAVLFAEGSAYFCPAILLDDVVDPTGAGDSFAGGFMGYMAAAGKADPEHFRQALVMGTITASFCCEGFSVERLASISSEDFAAREATLREFATLPSLEVRP